MTRKGILSLVLMLFLFLAIPMGGQVWAGQNTVTFEWEQPGEISDLAGWKLWVATTPGGPYDQGMVYFRDANGNPIAAIDIPYSGNPGATYTADNVTIVVPDGALTTLCFVVNAWDAQGNFSANSNEVCEPFDFVGPDQPINFKIKVKTRP